MKLEVLPMPMTVCKVAYPTELDMNVPFTFAARTDRELSLVCPTASAPADTLAREDGWRAFRVAGSMAFSMVGVLARLTDRLAAVKVSVFAVSTFDTDYLLVKADRLDVALAALEADGYGMDML